MIMKRSVSPSSAPVPTLFLIFLLSVLTCVDYGLCYGPISGGGCRQAEREALLKIKDDLKDPSGRLASWEIGNGTDCCSWYGVSCDNSTGHVLELHLRSLSSDKQSSGFMNDYYGSYSHYSDDALEDYKGSFFGGKISPFLLNLTHLRYLDLSNNEFERIQIPKFLGSMESLIHLNLSNAGFGGPIPPQLGNLTNLLYLNLNSNYDITSISNEKLQWISGLHSLEFLDLSGVDLSKAWDWMEVITSLPSLLELHLSSCWFPPIPLAINSSISVLSTLDLSENSLHQFSFFSWVSRFKHLRSLNLAYNSFHGSIPHELQNMTSIKELDLSGNSFIGFVPNWLFSLGHLELLNLAGNSLTSCQVRHVPPFLNATLSTLDLSENQFSVLTNCFCGVKTLISLSLSHNYYLGPISNELQNMTSLRQLDLSVSFLGSSIHKWLHSFTQLELLNLADSDLQGTFSSAFGNMTSLVSLDLSGNTKIVGGIPTSFKNLCNLRALSLSDVPLRQEVNKVFENLLGCGSKDLESLNLKNCQLFGNWIGKDLEQFKSLAFLDLFNDSISGPIPMSLVELKSLKVLDLSSNQLSGNLPIDLGKLNKLEALEISLNSFSGPIPTSLGELTLLRYLDLSVNKLDGTLPVSLGKLRNLKGISISYNSISGSLPMSLEGLASLREMDFCYNKLNGTLPMSFGRLSNLRSADISHNLMEGDVSEIHFANLSNLERLHASGNRLKLRVKPGWIPPFRLERLGLGSWHIGPQFPTWLRLLDLSALDLSNSGIATSIPIWFWNSSSQFYYLNLSQNQIHRVLPNRLQLPPGSIIVLSSNHFRGPVPHISSRTGGLDLSSNSLSGSISDFLCLGTHDMQYLNLENNLLSGEIPDCWMKWPNLLAIRLSNNSFDGRIPHSVGTLSVLSSLHLRNNSLSGELPLSLKNCKKLVTLDAGENKLVGNIPRWIGHGLPNLVVLNLRTNNIEGRIPKEICHTTSLHILDLADNRLSGNIPRCIGNLSGMVEVKDLSGSLSIWHNSSGTVIDSTLLQMKGAMLEYSTNLGLVRSIDLSSNRLSGQIPEVITELKGLQSLNLSHNFFRGGIPEDIGAMTSLESIDLSNNRLIGEIPQSISRLTFLGHLNLSHNNLSGRIPEGTQIQSFDPSCFIGNNELCGKPLADKCSDDLVVMPSKKNGGESGSDRHGSEMVWFYATVAFGFIVGFWGVVGPLLFASRWRLTYFQFLQMVEDKIYIWWHFMENEREALLKIKNDLVDPSDRLASWEIGNGTDCCSWYGVVCDNSTGRVLELHLASISYVEFRELHASSYLDGVEAFNAYQGLLFGGKISPSLLNLTHLESLNLSRSAFETIPKFLGSISSLKYLSISYYSDGIAGEVPPQLGNLTNLVHLNLHGYSVAKNFHWLSTLSSLQCLEFRDVDLSGVSNWFEVINTLPSLQDLTLSECQLLPPQSHPTIIKLNFSSLSILDLSYNSFSQSTISWVSHFKHLKSLNLERNSFQGSYIPHVLQNLTSLSELDLSGNGFYSSIPNWVYHGFPNLELLNLADNNFQGKISDDFQNLTSLITLDLSSNFELIGGIPTSLRNLCKLRTLSLSSLNFNQEVNEVFENLLGCGSNGLEMLDFRECNIVGNWSTKDLEQFKNLAFLDLSGNSISGPIPMSLGELKSLTSLDLSRNSVSGSIPMSLGEWNSLTSLDLSFNKLDGNLPINLGELRNLKEFRIRDNMISGPIPTSLVDLTFLRVIDFSENRLDGTLSVNFGNLKNLEAIGIFNNSISGPIPSSLGGLSLLRILHLSDNKLNGTLPSSFGKLSNLRSADISHNLMEGDVSEIHFKNLSNLIEFYASGNKLKLRVNSGWIPPLQLQYLLLGSWHIGTEFPIWLPSLKNLSSLDLSNSGLSSASIPSWFWNLSSQFLHLNLSQNHIHGVLPNELNFSGYIDLSSNHFQGALPHVSSDLTALDLSNNLLSGSISRFLCRKDYAIEFLNLEKNHLSREIPNCWNKWLELKAIKLSSNHFNGNIPKTIGSLTHLTSLHLRRNNLSGELPRSLGRCRNLVTLDIGENKLEGKIPRWIGEKLSKLVFLGLRTNNFGGRIPEEICGAASLHILDHQLN